MSKSELRPVVFVLENTYNEKEIDELKTGLVQIRMGEPVSSNLLPYFEEMEKELT